MKIQSHPYPSYEYKKMTKEQQNYLLYDMAMFCKEHGDAEAFENRPFVHQRYLLMILHTNGNWNLWLLSTDDLEEYIASQNPYRDVEIEPIDHLG